jgi:ABC-type molybdate transport system substrate-binding protein
MTRSPVLVLGLLSVPLLAAPAALRVKASPAVAPCVSAAAAEYQRTSGRRVTVETAAIVTQDSAAGADVVVAADSELNRVIESGTSDADLEVEVATIPWVLAGAPGAAKPDLRSLARTGSVVRTIGGAVAREPWRRLQLQGFSPARVERVRETPVRLQAGEAAVVPLSLAGAGPVTVLDVPPLRARAVGVSASPRKDADRAFLDFLATGAGNAAFRACGRTEAR